jgi:hypothetical protein
MRARHAVPLISSKSPGPPQLLSCKQTASITLLESTLVQVLMLKNLNLFRINTYEKHRGEGRLPLSRLGTPQKRVAHPLFFSNACAMPFPHLLSFNNHPFLWGGGGGGLPSDALLTSTPSGNRLAEV